jgi:hypothetical protein
MLAKTSCRSKDNRVLWCSEKNNILCYCCKRRAQILEVEKNLLAKERTARRQKKTIPDDGTGNVFEIYNFSELDPAKTAQLSKQPPHPKKRECTFVCQNCIDTEKGKQNIRQTDTTEKKHTRLDYAEANFNDTLREAQANMELKHELVQVKKGALEKERKDYDDLCQQIKKEKTESKLRNEKWQEDGRKLADSFRGP